MICHKIPTDKIIKKSPWSMDFSLSLSLSLSLSFSLHPSLSSIIPGRSSKLHSVSAQIGCEEVLIGQPTLARPCVEVYGKHKAMMALIVTGFKNSLSSMTDWLRKWTDAKKKLTNPNGWPKERPPRSQKIPKKEPYPIGINH